LWSFLNLSGFLGGQDEDCPADSGTTTDLIIEFQSKAGSQFQLWMVERPP